MNLPNVKVMFQDAARGLGGKLRCATCGREQPCSERDASGFLARGWPKCCGYTMELVTGQAARRD